jgi:intracellular septation protein
VTGSTTRPSSPGLRMAVEYGPLLVFFAVNFLLPASLAMRLVASGTGFLSDLDRAGALVIAKVIVATSAFVLATIAAMIVTFPRCCGFPAALSCCSAG